MSKKHVTPYELRHCWGHVTALCYLQLKTTYIIRSNRQDQPTERTVGKMSKEGRVPRRKRPRTSEKQIDICFLPPEYTLSKHSVWTSPVPNEVGCKVTGIKVVLTWLEVLSDV